MLSLEELRRAARIAHGAWSGARLRRVVQAGPFSLVLVLEKARERSRLLLCCSPRYARISGADAAGPESAVGSFGEYARAHLAGSTLEGVEAASSDRQVCLRFQSRAGVLRLLLSILGPRSNLYLLDEAGVLLHSLRPTENTRPELKAGAPWVESRGFLASAGEDRWATVPDDRFLDAVAEDYGRRERAHEVEVAARRIEQAVRKEQAFLGRKHANLEDDLGRAMQAESHRRLGELLKGVLHAVGPGQPAVAATDYATGETVEIPLDPKLSPAENLESYFARYQKETRGAGMIRLQLEQLRAEQQRLDACLRDLDRIARLDPPDPEALGRLAASPPVRRLLGRLPPANKRVPAAAPVKKDPKPDLPSRLRPKKYRTGDGMEIWVGRSDEGNDLLTTRLARGNDLFFHLELYPGSHVVLRTEGRAEAAPESVLAACELAVHFSKMKNATRADVHMAPIKNVKKPRGAKPGLVYVRGGRTVHLKRDPKRLEAILASRLEE